LKICDKIAASVGGFSHFSHFENVQKRNSELERSQLTSLINQPWCTACWIGRPLI